MADPYRSAQAAPAGPARTDYQAPSDPPRDDRRGRRRLHEYDPRSRTAVTPLLLMKSLDRIETLMRAGTADAFQTAQQELHAMAKLMRQAGARTAEETSRRERLLALLDQVERRVDAMAARRASAAEGFAPFKAATSRGRAPNEIARNASAKPGETVAPALDRDASNVAAGMPSIAPRFFVPATGATPVRPPIARSTTNERPGDATADEDAYVPFEMETRVEPVLVTPAAKAAGEDVPAKPMPKTMHSIAQRIAPGTTLPALADLTEEERLALFT